MSYQTSNHGKWLAGRPVDLEDIRIFRTFKKITYNTERNVGSRKFNKLSNLYETTIYKLISTILPIIWGYRYIWEE